MTIRLKGESGDKIKAKVYECRYTLINIAVTDTRKEGDK